MRDGTKNIHTSKLSHLILVGYKFIYKDFGFVSMYYIDQCQTIWVSNL